MMFLDVAVTSLHFPRFECLCRVLGVVVRCKFDMSFWVPMWYSTWVNLNFEGVSMSAENPKKSRLLKFSMHGGGASPCPYTKPGSVALDAFWTLQSRMENQKPAQDVTWAWKILGLHSLYVFQKKVLSILSSTWFLRGFSYFNPDMSVWL